MSWYVGRRLIEILPVFFGVLLVVFAIAHLTPGDPVLVALGEHATPAAVEKLRAELQLNDPLPVDTRPCKAKAACAVRRSRAVTSVARPMWSAVTGVTPLEP